MATGTAHILFPSGSLTLPAQTPYDRQLLIEHVLGTARSKQQVYVRVDHTTWVVEAADRRSAIPCRGCGRRMDDAVCRRRRRGTAAYCIACALAQPQLSIAFLSELPADAVLRDVQAHYAYGGSWTAWMRWPQATPSEIIDDMRLQRRFAPVLTWRCAEIRLPPPRPGGAKDSPHPSPLRFEEAVRRPKLTTATDLPAASLRRLFSTLRASR